MADAPKVRASLIEIFRRFIPTVKEGNEHVYWNGDDNLYPYEIEGVIANSPSAKRAAGLMAKFIAGSGVVDESGNLIPYESLPLVNIQKQYKITDIIRIAAPNIAKQNGCWFHIGYGIVDGEIAPNKLDVLDYCKPRKGKKDDEDNAGKIFLKKDWAEKSKFGTGKKNEARWYYPFNPDKAVVMEQIKKDAKGVSDLETAIKKYRGQVFYLNLTPEYEYALSRFDAVYNDCDSEYRFGLHTNNELRTGFLGKVLVVTQGLEEEDAEKVKKDLSGWLGAENSGSLYHLDVEKTKDIKNYVHVEQLKPQFDDKLFEVTDKRVRRNILGAANNIPEALVTASDGALFGTNADTYKQMKIFYSEQTEEERGALEQALTKIGFPTKIEPIIKPETTPSVQ